MARNKHTSNGIQPSHGLPPASTLAAQFIQNHTQPAGNRTAETLTFSQILHEILHNHAATPEIDLATNVKLISVVAEAGLGPLADHNPFHSQPDVVISQARDSIAVIRSTIERQPAVLFSPANPDGPVLALSLLARLAAVCVPHLGDEQLISDLLAVAVSSLDRSIDLWPVRAQFVQLIQECVEEAIILLETNSTTGVALKLPPVRTISRLWPESGNGITLPSDLQTIVSSRVHALSIAVEFSGISSLPARWRTDTGLRLKPLFEQLCSDPALTDDISPLIARVLTLSNDLSLLKYLFLNLGDKPHSIHVQQQMAKCLSCLLRDDIGDELLQLGAILVPLTTEVFFQSLHENLRNAINMAISQLRKFQQIVNNSENAATTKAVTGSGHATLAIRQSPAQHDFVLSAPKRRRLNAKQDHRDSRVPDGQPSNTSPENGTRTENMTLSDGNSKKINSVDEHCAMLQDLIDHAPRDPSRTRRAMLKLLDSKAIYHSTQSRILAVLAIEACAKQSDDPIYVDLAASTFGQFCLKSLHSSSREIRLAAGHCLPAFLRPTLAQDLLANNRRVALEYLRALSERNVASEHETLICAWANVGLVCGAKELNLILLRLVEYLGHANPVIAGLAHVELERMAHAKKSDVGKMVKPFWSSIAVSVVQDLQNRPQKAQRLCDLLCIEVNRFLVLTQRETVPSLVLAKRTTILKRIAAARGNSVTVQDVCLQPRTTLAGIVALLLIRYGSRAKDEAIACLKEIAPGFGSTDLPSLIKTDPVLIAIDILKFIADESDERKAMGYQAFRIFAALAEQGSSSRSVEVPEPAIWEFFEVHVLGIMTVFSEVLEDTQGVQPDLEKNLILKAIAEMILLAGSSMNNSLPQLRACLQSAMEQASLREAAFTAWLNMTSVLDTDGITQVIDQTFASVRDYWETFSEDLQQSTWRHIAEMIKNHNQVMQENIMTIPDISGIPLLAKFASEIQRLRSQRDDESHFKAFVTRLKDESKTIVIRAVEELVPFLGNRQSIIHDWATSEQPNTLFADLIRSLLDATAKYSYGDEKAADMFGQALGIVGCLDPNRVEVARKKRSVTVLYNFDRADELVDWALVFLEDVLVKVFKSVSNAKNQGFVAYVIQELLGFCGFSPADGSMPRATQAPSSSERFNSLPEHIRITLTPLLTSKYMVTTNYAVTHNRSYPGFSASTEHATWLRFFVHDLMCRAKGENSKLVFLLVARLVRGNDVAIASFMLPYVALSSALEDVPDANGLSDEFIAVLGHVPKTDAERETVKLCSESVFSALDYMSTWLLEKKKALGTNRANAFRTGHALADFDEVKDMDRISTIENFLARIPADLMATQAQLCGSHARALFHWEQHIRKRRPLIPSEKPFQGDTETEKMYNKLQEIYAGIDEPDGLEGIAAHLNFLTEDQQAIQHAKAGRWTAAQTWYEIQLSKAPGDIGLEEKLLSCLRETGRYGPLLRYSDAFLLNQPNITREQLALRRSRLMPITLEAYWTSGDLKGMETCLGPKEHTTDEARDDSLAESINTLDFSSGVAQALAATMRKDVDVFKHTVKSLRIKVTQSMTIAGTSSIQAYHEDSRRLHALYELEALQSQTISASSLDRRLSVLGSYASDKQYILGLRRAIVAAQNDQPRIVEIGASWLSSAKISRQTGNTESAYNATLEAYECGIKAAKLEEARLLWRDGHQRHAIQALEAAIKSGIFESAEIIVDKPTEISGTNHKQNMLSAKAHLLLAKWLDASGQRQTKDLMEGYQYPAKQFMRWEKGHYYLGKHYQKLLEAEKALPESKQTSAFLSGDLTRLVIENLMRSIPFGNKYWHQTIPKVLTLWLNFGHDIMQKGAQAQSDVAVADRRVKNLSLISKFFAKYFERVPSYVFYSALPQLISRITHPNPEVWKVLNSVLTRIITNYPNQALWSILAVVKASDRLRVDRGHEVLNRVKDSKNRFKSSAGATDLRMLIAHGQRLSEGLLNACEIQVKDRISQVSLSKDLGFSHKLAPSQLVVPIEMTLTASGPTNGTGETIRHHKPFVHDRVTISSFVDEVLVLSSLQRPRKLTVRGSDGKLYGLLCKPKDDLRKDQRLMEFNSVINRGLKRDAESSKRRLYIKTYAVTPLSEESGTIEWVEGIKPMRDIIIGIYNRKGLRPNYHEIRNILQEATTVPGNLHLFRDKVLATHPAALHEWFAEVYPEPDAWFAARLRYARSAAVMSMVGHVLGLGDRHGENILLEEGTGGVFHVDFNCLFDKGLTFEKPELVPFRLTHNMVDAMGPYGYEGPFRKSSEVTSRLLRQSKETLMTVLETFLYDPTTDFVGKKKRTTPGVPETPQEILDSVESKLKGLFWGEALPMSVEGYVDVLIRKATDDFNLASMYIGWCAFL